MVQPFKSIPDADAPDTARAPAQPAAGLLCLVASGDANVRQGTMARLAAQGARVMVGSSIGSLRLILENANPIALVLLDLSLSRGRGIEAMQEIQHLHPGARIVALVSSRQPQRIVEAFRLGACDVILKPLSDTELDARITRALTLPAAPKQTPSATTLNTATPEPVRMPGADLYTRPAPAVASPGDLGTIGRKYGARVGDALDLELMIRQALNLALELVGPTNACVFLQGESDDYGLGGYINHDFAREDGQQVLEHLAKALGNRFDEMRAPVHMKSPQAIEAWAAENAVYFEDDHLLALPVPYGGECVAGLLLFRDADTGFNPEQTEALVRLSEAFGQALGRLIRVHHRHMEI